MNTYLAIIGYANGGTDGVIIKAKSRGEAWGKPMSRYGGGETVLRVELSEVIEPIVK